MYDPTTGLLQDSARMYDPALARFLTPDPLSTQQDSQSLSAYSYSLNNPISMSDPSGLHAWGDAWKGIKSGASDFVGATVRTVTQPIKNVSDTWIANDTAWAAGNESLGKCLWNDAEVALVTSVNTIGPGGLVLAVAGVAEMGGTVYKDAYDLATGKGSVEKFSHDLTMNVLLVGSIFLTDGAADAVEGGMAARDARLAAAAEDARDTLANKVGPSKATVAGGYNRLTGRVVAGCNRNPTGCAENDIERQIGFKGLMKHVNNWVLRFTEAKRPRTGKPVKVCRFCQERYEPYQFSVKAQPQEGGRFRGYAE